MYGKFHDYNYLLCKDSANGKIIPEQKKWRPRRVAILKCSAEMPLDAHLLDKPLSTTNFVYYEQDVADVANNVAAQGLVKLDVGHRREPCAVEVNTDKLALAVENGRA